MTPIELIEACANAGFRVWASGETLKIEGVGSLPDALKATLRESKPEVLALLARQAANMPGWCAVPELALPLVKEETQAAKAWAMRVIDYVLGQTWRAVDWAMSRSLQYASKFEVWSHFRCEFEASLDLVLWQRDGRMMAKVREKQFHEVATWIGGMEIW